MTRDRHLWSAVLVALACMVEAGAVRAGGFPASPVSKCAPDAAVVGQACVDKYEASVWWIPYANTSLIKKVKKGSATLLDLQSGGATQVSPSPSCNPTFISGFPANGQWTEPLYAVSVAGVKPTGCVTWFQADQICALSGKRLLTNAEWQRAVAGTPDPGADDGSADCNTALTHSASDTGARSACVSSWGAVDMVGNLYEWVADWTPRSSALGEWSAGISPTGDDQGLAGAAGGGEPGALLRGGDYNSGEAAGPFAISGLIPPSGSDPAIGFRCAR